MRLSDRVPPVASYERNSNDQKENVTGKSRPKLNLFIKTWPPKRNNEKEEENRPLTATLEKPQVLDINLMGKIDMSLIRKEFLCLTNLTLVPLVKKTNATVEALKPDRNNNPRRVGVAKSTKLPEPCKTCGRSDQPERFHSHPVVPAGRKMSSKLPTKISVQKPTSINYESKKPKVSMCYLCGREYGSVSLPLHEPKCLEKWQRDNAKLPEHLRRKLPEKPKEIASIQEWNKFAWDSSQAILVPCDRCGRTFLPERLSVHRRSCKPSTTAVSLINRIEENVERKSDIIDELSF